MLIKDGQVIELNLEEIKFGSKNMKEGKGYSSTSGGLQLREKTIALAMSFPLSSPFRLIKNEEIAK